MTQYRLFGFPIREWQQEHTSTIAKIADDLGRPCDHKFTRGLKCRMWGLLVRDSASWNGIFTLVDDEWYDEEMRRKVQMLKNSSESLPDKYYRKVLLDFDNDYWDQFFDSLRAGESSLPAAAGERDQEQGTPTAEPSGRP